MDKAAKVFFSSQRFAVAGASSDPSKFGNKIFAWYLDHNITPTPLNPSASSVTVSGSEFPTKPGPSSLSSAKEETTSLSVITPPKVTLNLLKEAKEAGVKAVWLQPGTFDNEILQFAKETFPGAAVGGDGWCVLVHGEDAMRDAGRKEGRL